MIDKLCVLHFNISDNSGGYGSKHHKGSYYQRYVMLSPPVLSCSYWWTDHVKNRRPASIHKYVASASVGVALLILYCWTSTVNSYTRISKSITNKHLVSPECSYLSLYGAAGNTGILNSVNHKHTCIILRHFLASNTWNFSKPQNDTLYLSS